MTNEEVVQSHKITTEPTLCARDPNLWMNTPEVGYALRLNRVTIFQMIKSGRLQATRTSERRWKVHYQDLLAYMREKKIDQAILSSWKLAWDTDTLTEWIAHQRAIDDGKRKKKKLNA